MQCPHCLTDIHPQQSVQHLGHDAIGTWYLRISSCSACGRYFFDLLLGDPPKGGQPRKISQELLVFPKGHGRRPCPKDVPQDLAKDYTEACLVLHDSPNASAALSRRCLQHFLPAHGNVTHGNLSEEIDDYIVNHHPPSHISAELHVVREIGNFAAHPTKDAQTGIIIDVEPVEAEANLNALESMFDFFFVGRENSKQRLAALNQKRQQAGKAPIQPLGTTPPPPPRT